MKPLLSIVMPTYNGETFISQALEGVREQYRSGMELVVVDDGSSDGTLERIKRFSAFFPIRLITPGRIGNWVTISNIGLREALGEWVCLLHQDDFWLPGRISRLWGEMEVAPGPLIVHNAIFVGPDAQRLGPWTCPITDDILPADRFIEHLLVQNFIAIASPTFRRSVALDSGGLDESLWLSPDWDLWLRLGAIGPVRFISDELCAFRVHAASQTAARNLAPNEWEQQLTIVFERHLSQWGGKGARREAVARAARASISVNCALAAASRSKPFKLSDPIVDFLALGPIGWRRYLRDSRIMQRVVARRKLARRAVIGRKHSTLVEGANG